ncbi:hypothetical protein [Terrabacter sp. RAF57]|uniref:SLOG cluster 4 domain-containing protein n=1 Tax=Terrabacter sp. RAF57 TaxID=3233063 RepID=UPI003F9B8E4E
MTINHDRPVIGVFGSAIGHHSERDAVVLLAEAIHRAGALLLSGAEPPDGGYPADFKPTDVKDVAVHALHSLTSEQEVLWIGVGRHHDTRESKRHGDRGIGVTPGWDHRRNFVEAAICDAAFAIGATSPGTASEVLFCLYLGRPVTVISRRPHLILSAANLKITNGNRVQPSVEGRPVDVGVKGALDWADKIHSQVITVALPTNSLEADALVQNLQDSLPQGRTRRAFEKLTDEDGWDDYLRTEMDIADRGW